MIDSILLITYMLLVVLLVSLVMMILYKLYLSLNPSRESSSSEELENDFMNLAPDMLYSTHSSSDLEQQLPLYHANDEDIDKVRRMMASSRKSESSRKLKTGDSSKTDESRRKTFAEKSSSFAGHYLSMADRIKAMKNSPKVGTTGTSKYNIVPNVNKKDKQNNDRIIKNSSIDLTSSASGKSAKFANVNSYGSRKSTGFVPTSKQDAQVLQSSENQSSKNTSSFLDLLDQLNEITNDEKESSKKRAKMLANATFTASSSGLESSVSDETASQTLIGKFSESNPDPEQINLSLISRRDTFDETSSLVSKPE